MTPVIRKKCRLEDRIGTVAQSDFRCDLGGVDVIYLDIVLGKVSFHLVRQVLGQFFAFPDGVAARTYRSSSIRESHRTCGGKPERGKPRS